MIGLDMSTPVPAIIVTKAHEHTRARCVCQGLVSGCHFWTNINFVHKDCGKRRKGRPSHELNEIRKLIYSRAHGRLEQR